MDTSSDGEDSENFIRSAINTNSGNIRYSEPTLYTSIDSTVHSGQNGRIIRGNSNPRSASKAPLCPQRYQLRSNSRIQVQDPWKEERERAELRGEKWDKSVERRWSTERAKRRGISNSNDNSDNNNNNNNMNNSINNNNNNNFEDGDRTYRIRNEDTTHTHNEDRRDARKNVINSHYRSRPTRTPPPLYMVPTASFASKLKILKPENTKRKPGMKVGCVSTARTYDTNMNMGQHQHQHHMKRNHSFNSAYDSSRRAYSGFSSSPSVEDFREYGDDVREYEPYLTDSPYGHDSPYVQGDNLSALRDSDREIGKGKGKEEVKEFSIRSKDFQNSFSMLRNGSGSTELVRGSYSLYRDTTDIDAVSIPANEYEHEDESENSGVEYGYSNNYFRLNSSKLNRNFENNNNNAVDAGDSGTKESNLLLRQNRSIDSNVHESPLFYRTDNGRVRDQSAGRSRSSHRAGVGIGTGLGDCWDSQNYDEDFSINNGSRSWPVYGRGQGQGHDSGLGPESESPRGIFTMPNFKRYNDTVQKSRAKK